MSVCAARVISVLCVLPFTVFASTDSLLSSEEICLRLLNAAQRSGQMRLVPGARPVRSTPPHREVVQAFRDLMQTSAGQFEYGYYESYPDGRNMLFGNRRYNIQRTPEQLHALRRVRSDLLNSARAMFAKENVQVIEASHYLPSHDIRSPLFILRPKDVGRPGRATDLYAQEYRSLVVYDPLAPILQEFEAQVSVSLRALFLPLSGDSVDEMVHNDGVDHETVHLRSIAMRGQRIPAYFLGHTRLNFRGTISQHLVAPLSHYRNEMPDDEPLAHAAELEDLRRFLKQALEQWDRDPTRAASDVRTRVGAQMLSLRLRILPMFAAGIEMAERRLRAMDDFDPSRSTWFGADRFLIAPSAFEPLFPEEFGPPRFDLEYTSGGFGGVTYQMPLMDPTLNADIHSLLQRVNLTQLSASSGVLSPESTARIPSHAWNLAEGDQVTVERVPQSELKDLSDRVRFELTRNTVYYEGFLRLLQREYVGLTAQLGRVAEPSEPLSREQVEGILIAVERAVRLRREVMNPRYFEDRAYQRRVEFDWSDRTPPLPEPKEAYLTLRRKPVEQWSRDDIDRTMFPDVHVPHKLFYLIPKLSTAVLSATLDFMIEPTPERFAAVLREDTGPRPEVGHYLAFGARTNPSQRAIREICELYWQEEQERKKQAR